MALFTNKTKARAEKPPTAAASNKAFSNILPDFSHILLKPRITEKATMHVGMGIYTFDVAVTANKRQITEAVRHLYKVNPRMVRVVQVPSKLKRNVRTGKEGVKSGGKKAYVYLKKGDTITLN
jgi:large subunit ribosomal protein L23